MTNDDNFGPWIDWAGGECPIPDAKAGEFELRRGAGPDAVSSTDAIGLHWGEFGKYPSFTIRAYRVRLPETDLLRQAIEALKLLNALNENYAPFGGEIYQDRVERAWESTRAVLAIAKERGL